MKYKSILIALLIGISFGPNLGQAQDHSQVNIKPDSAFRAVFIGESRPLRDIKPSPLSKVEKGKKILKDIPNFKGKKSKKNNRFNPNPKIDALWLASQSRLTRRLSASTTILNQEGQTFSNVTPPDPVLDVGSNHIVQMINGQQGSLMEIKDKKGNTVYGPANLSNLWDEFNLDGLGDPIVMYDRFAKRWFLSEFGLQGNVLLIAISTSDDPLGSYYSYAISTPNFPDYPKYSIWNNAYFCTTNEFVPIIYALDRQAMLEGRDPAVQRFQVNYQSIYFFNSLAPVTMDGDDLPPASTPASFWRHLDDEAHNPSTSISSTDKLEYWELSVDFSNQNNSRLIGPFSVSVTDFDSDINGYFSFSGIQQPNAAITLDPLREVLMNRMQYRNFGSYQTIVATHVCDVDGRDRAGIRWYELRRQTGGQWQLHQEGTHAPTQESRWMSSISMDGQGNIALVYSVSGESTFPSLRYTGRLANDPLGQMTLTEQSIAEGRESNNNSRYGDYASLTVDPSNDTDFWFTGEYNPTAFWSTRITAFSLFDLCQDFRVQAEASEEIICASQAFTQIEASAQGGKSPYLYSLDGNDFQNTGRFENVRPGEYQVTIKDANGCELKSSKILIQEASPLKVVSQSETLSCFDAQNGSITAQADGGIAPLSYSLNGQSPQSSPVFENLGGGTYILTVRDASGCQQAQDTVVITKPPVIEAQIETKPLACSESQNGMIEILASGGTAPLSYSLNGTTYQNTPRFENLGEGNYQVYIQDAQGCVFLPDTVSLGATNPLSFVVLVTQPTPEAPNQGAIEIAAFGGEGTYTYSIDGINFQTSNLIQGLGEGIYKVYVKDAKGCLSIEEVEINILVATVRNLQELVDIFPNPTFDDFSLKINGRYDSDNLGVQLIDSHGAVVLSQELNPNEVIEPIEFSMRSYPRGTYFLVLRSEIEKTTIKIVYN